MLCIGLLLPLLMLGIGRGWKKNPPGQINGVYGYRTKWSGKSQETWDYAHRLVAALWIRLGAILLAVSAAVLGVCLFLIEDESFYNLSAIVMIIQTAAMLATIYPVEKGLRTHFDEDGRRIR